VQRDAGEGSPAHGQCALVHGEQAPRRSSPEDQAAWVGAPVSALDTHPIFLTMPVVRTVHCYMY
jgi:hypothetical protein